jgi:hypothetical protein
MGRTVGRHDAGVDAREALKSADMTLAVEVDGFGTLDWRRADELIDRAISGGEKARRAAQCTARAMPTGRPGSPAAMDGRRKEVRFRAPSS